MKHDRASCSVSEGIRQHMLVSILKNALSVGRDGDGCNFLPLYTSILLVVRVSQKIAFPLLYLETS